MIAAYNEPLSRRLNVLPGFRWLFDLKPGVGGLALLMLSPVMMWIFDILIVHGYVVPLSYQWFSALADTALALGGGVLLAILKPWLHYAPVLLQRQWVHWLIVAFFFAFSAWHMAQERGSFGGWDRRTGPNYLYHNLFLVPVLGYVLTVAAIAAASGLFSAIWFWRRSGLMTRGVYAFGFALALFVLCGLVWVSAGLYDGTHQFAPNGVSKHEYANPAHPWQGGLIPQFLQWVWYHIT